MTNTLGPLIRERRTELGLTQSDVAARGGPSHQTLRNIETGPQLPPLRDFTLTRLENVLLLRRGTIRRHLREGTPLEAIDTTGQQEMQAHITAMLSSLQPKAAHRRYGQMGQMHSIRINDDMWKDVQALATQNGVTASDIVREAIAAYLA